MKNTLKYVLIAVGLLLLGYGLYGLFEPEFFLEEDSIPIEGEQGENQLLAILALGILSLLAGLAFNRR